MKEGAILNDGVNVVGLTVGELEGTRVEVAEGEYVGVKEGANVGVDGS